MKIILAAFAAKHLKSRDITKNLKSFRYAKVKNILINTIIRFQFSYCLLFWMFCTRKSNCLENYLHERTLRAVYDDHSSSYSELIMTKSEPTIYQHKIIAKERI